MNGLNWRVLLPRAAFVGIVAAVGMAATLVPDFCLFEPKLEPYEMNNVPIQLADARVVRISINTAGAAELEQIPGIGKKIAHDIIQYRTEHGAFHKRTDLMKVSGVGHKTYEKLKDFICL